LIHVGIIFIFFFFSSRRRHTRSKRDWSSDVCSSDLFFADLDQAETIYLYSTGWQQQIIAEYLAHNFFLIGKKAIILPSARDEVALLGRSARENDMLFVISFGGFNKTIIEELKKIDVVNTELKLVSLTSWQTGKLASLSDYSFFFKTTPFQFSKQNAVTFSSA